MRRVDPKGRTIGQFIREELKGCEGKMYSDRIIAHLSLPYILAVESSFAKLSRPISFF